MIEIRNALREYDNGNGDAAYQVIEKMMPLIKKLASQIHFMEKDDSIQELSISIIQVLSKTNRNSSEEECISFFKKVLENHYKKLCKKNLSNKIQQVELDDNNRDFFAEDFCSNIFYLDVYLYIKKMPANKKKEREILKLFLFEGMSDENIGKKMHISRQYVHRIRKKLLQDFWKTNYVEEGKKI